MKKFFLALTLASAILQADRTVLVLQYPPDQRINVNMHRTGAVDKIDGEAEVKYRFKGDRSCKVDVSIKDAPAPSSVKPEYQAYVVWAVDEKGGFTNLGAISKGLKADTSLKAFGIVISLESDPKALAPKGLFVLESEFPAKKGSFFGMFKVTYTKQP